jgi:glycosyltransferase involved in cell wall biosynthesis
MARPALTVLFGQPDRLSTSYQTRHLAAALERWFSLHPIRIRQERGWRRHLDRLTVGYLRPLLTRPRGDFLLYANDGLADLRLWRARTILYWYDAPWDWSARPPRFAQWHHWLRCQNVRHADWVFAVSSTQVEMARRLRPGREASVVYLPVGVDCRTFDTAGADAGQVKRQFGLPDKVIVGYLGYLTSWAGRFAGEQLAEIAPHLSQTHDVHFLVVGFGPALAKFQARVAELGVANRFTFTGYVPDALLPSCVAAMDVCLDILEEGFHSLARSETKLKQYLAMGRACVATAIGENVVDLDGGRCGVLARPGAEGLLEGVRQLVGNPDRRVQLGTAARERAVAVYDWPRLAERLVAALGLEGEARRA